MARAPLVTILLALLVAPAAGAALDRADARLAFTFAPQKAFQDKKATVEVAVRPRGSRCSLSIKYADGRRAALGTRVATRGKARWTWTVPNSVEAGAARVTVSCSRVGSRSRTIVIVGAQEVPTRLFVTRQGLTQRPDASGGGSFVSFGLVLANHNAAHDIVDVGVLVNFLNAESRVLASKTLRVAGVAAGSEFYVGDSMQMLSQVPVTRLEVVVTSAKAQPRALVFPALAAVAIEPSRWDKGWVGAVAGELINDHASKTLRSARLSIVVVDAEGGILGGGTAFAFSPLPPGSRILFKSSFGFKSIPIERAATLLISVEPSWSATA